MTYVKRLDPRAVLPTYAHPGDAGADLSCIEYVYLMPDQWKAVRTGLALEIPPGYAGFVHPRSGLAKERGVTVLNAPGVIDSGYRGEVKVLLINHGETDVHLDPGDRIAQLIIQRVRYGDFIECDLLTPTARDRGGFGSTGVRQPTAGGYPGLDPMDADTNGLGE